MSKIGQKPIIIPESVLVDIKNQEVKVKGKEGELVFKLPAELKIKRENNQLLVTRLKEDKKVKGLHGLYRQLINNAIKGVERLWIKRLEIVGTGYNVKMQGENLVFKLGYSHPVIFKKNEGVRFQVEGGNKIIVMGVDKQKVGEIAYQIKMLKKPDVYKGKGIKYEGEKLRIKPGKKAKAAAGA